MKFGLNIMIFLQVFCKSPTFSIKVFPYFSVELAGVTAQVVHGHVEAQLLPGLDDVEVELRVQQDRVSTLG